MRWLKSSRRLKFLMVIVAVLVLIYLFISTWLRVKLTLATKEFLLISLPNQEVQNEPLTLTLSPPGVVLEPGGGLGNQFFEFACGYSLARSLGVKFWLRIPKGQLDLPKSVLGPGPGDREFSLSYFNISYTRIKWEDEDGMYEAVKKILRSTITLTNIDILGQIQTGAARQNSGGGNPQPVFKIGDGCESEIFFRPFAQEIRMNFDMSRMRDFLFPTENAQLQFLLDEIENSEFISVGIHVRRGDFLQDTYRVIPTSYYRRAMTLLKEKVKGHQRLKYFIFSDDIEFSRREFGKFPEAQHMTFVSNLMTKSNLQDFYLMLKCKHLIIPNSTFSWWAGYLNSNKGQIIIAPSPMFKQSFYEGYSEGIERDFQKYIHETNAHPSEWLTVQSFDEF